MIFWRQKYVPVDELNTAVGIISVVIVVIAVDVF